MERNTELLLRVARMYHVQSETMDAIAHHLGVSRSTVSRLLKEARDRGLVRVTIADPDRPMTRLAEIFRKSFHVQAHLVNVRPGSSYMLRLEQVAKVAARLLDDIVTDSDVVGVAWGTTVSAVAQHLRPQRTTGLPYVGSILQRFAVAFHGEEQFLALPAFFDNPGTRTAMWAERSTRHMLQVRASCTKAVFGVGGLGSELQSHVYSANYLDETDLDHLKAAGVVGDVCTVMLRADGSWSGIPINDRATGMTPAELQMIPRRICVVSGPGKAVAVLGALRARVATDLVIDEETARAVLHEMRPGSQTD